LKDLGSATSIKVEEKEVGKQDTLSRLKSLMQKGSIRRKPPPVRSIFSQDFAHTNGGNLESAPSDLTSPSSVGSASSTVSTVSAQPPQPGSLHELPTAREPVTRRKRSATFSGADKREDEMRRAALAMGNDEDDTARRSLDLDPSNTDTNDGQLRQ